MIIVYIDIILLVILLVLSVSTCAYCCCRVHRLRQAGQLTIMLRPTKVVFSNKKENDGNDELRTVVAYRNPFTGDYCVHKHRTEPRGCENEMARCETESADSGLSDEYEPLNVVPQKVVEPRQPPLPPLLPAHTAADVNSVNKTWNWNYKEYQI